MNGISWSGRHLSGVAISSLPRPLSSVAESKAQNSEARIQEARIQESRIPELSIRGICFRFEPQTSAPGLFPVILAHHRVGRCVAVFAGGCLRRGWNVDQDRVGGQSSGPRYTKARPAVG